MTLHPRIAPLAGWLQRHRIPLSIGATLLVLGVAFAALHAILQDVSAADIRAALAAVAAPQIALSLALVTLSYLLLSGYDMLALDAIGKPQRWRRAALGAFSAYSFSHNLGFAPVTGAATRWRAYRGTNLDPGDIARIVVIAGVTFWLGIILMLGLFLVFIPDVLRIHDRVLPHPVQAALGGLILTVITLYLLACWKRLGPIRILGWHLPVPTIRHAAIQFPLAAADISLAALALLVLLPPESWHHAGAFIVAYVVAITVALLAHAPGGLGVFEAVILVSLPDVDRAALVSALILYRLLYYWLPFLVAALLLAAKEVRHRRRRPFSIPQGPGF